MWKSKEMRLSLFRKTYLNKNVHHYMRLNYFFIKKNYFLLEVGSRISCTIFAWFINSSIIEVDHYVLIHLFYINCHTYIFSNEEVKFYIFKYYFHRFNLIYCKIWRIFVWYLYNINLNIVIHFLSQYYNNKKYRFYYI